MAQRPRYADFAHSKSPKNLAGPNWCMTPVGSYFKDGKMNRDSHSEVDNAEPSRVGMGGKTVRVEHFHYKAKD